MKKKKNIARERQSTWKLQTRPNRFRCNILRINATTVSDDNYCVKFRVLRVARSRVRVYVSANVEELFYLFIFFFWG